MFCLSLLRFAQNNLAKLAPHSFGTFVKLSRRNIIILVERQLFLDFLEFVLRHTKLTSNILFLEGNFNAIQKTGLARTRFIDCSELEPKVAIICPFWLSFENTRRAVECQTEFQTKFIDISGGTSSEHR